MLIDHDAFFPVKLLCRFIKIFAKLFLVSEKRDNFLYWFIAFDFLKFI